MLVTDDTNCESCSNDNCTDHPAMKAALKQLVKDTAEIKLALLGDFSNKGFITVMHEQINDHERRLKIIEEFIDDARKKISGIMWKVVGGVMAGIVTGSMAAVKITEVIK